MITSKSLSWIRIRAFSAIMVRCSNFAPLYFTSRALPGFPGHLQHWLKIIGGNTIQKYCYNANFIPIGQLEAEIQHSGPHFWPQLWDPWSNSKKNSYGQSTYYGGVQVKISAFQVQYCGRSCVRKAFWTTFLALALGPLVQFQKNFLGTIYQIWRGSGPIFSPLGPKMWEELH